MAGLMNVPGLRGILQARAVNEESANNDLRQQMGQLQQVGVLQGILAKRQEQQELEQIKGVMSQSQGDPVKAFQGLMQLGTPTSMGIAVKMRDMMPKPPGFKPVGAGGLYDEAKGVVIPPAAKPNDKVTWSEPFQMGGAWVQRSSDGQIKQAVAREPQIKVTNEPPVTPVTIQDPNDPLGTIVIDGRTKKVLGKGPKMTEAGKIDAKTNLQMTGLGADLQQAEDLLMGVSRTTDGQVVKGNLPTGSGIGAAYDAAAGFFGATPSGAAEADSLKTVAARLVSRIPRFEGPQSDRDVKLYQQAAGDAGNEKLPRARRIAAVKTMRQIYQGYESGQRGRLIGNRRATDKSAGNVVNFADLPE